MSKLIDKVIEVEFCGLNCPFFNYIEEMSSDCNATMEVRFDKKAKEVLYNDKPYLHPKCPLRKGKILVELKKSEK
jgi:hypothetical protein